MVIGGASERIFLRIIVSSQIEKLVYLSDWKDIQVLDLDVPIVVAGKVWDQGHHERPGDLEEQNGDRQHRARPHP